MNVPTNLKQLGLALHNYAQGHGVFPAGAISGPETYHTNHVVINEADYGQHGTSWMLQILPYVEQGNMFDRWDFSKNVKGNVAIATVDIPMFYCPSRRRGVRSEDVRMMFQGWQSGGTDYGGCVSNANSFSNIQDHSFGPHWLLEGGVDRQGMVAAGVFLPNRFAALAAVRDGTSNTLMVGEVQRLFGALDQRGYWGYRSQDGWAVGGVATLFETAVFPRNDVYANPGGVNNGFFESPGSDHAGGAQFCYVDGSVHFVSENSDARTLEAMGSRDGGEVVDTVP